MSEELDARQKGDIYWKKLKRYLEARASRESSLEDTDSALATARDIYACAKNLDEFEKKNPHRLVTGEEFKVMPPTATGEEVFMHGILLVSANLKRFIKLVESPAEDDVVIKLLASLIDVMKTALKSYYNSSGIDEVTGEKISAAEREKARDEHDEIIRRYNSEVKNFRTNVSNEIVKGMIKEIVKTGKAGNHPVPETDDAFDACISLNPGAYEENRAEIEKVRNEYCTYLKKEAELKGMLPLIKEAAEEKTSQMTAPAWISPTEAYEEYGRYLDERLRALAYARRCCLAYVRCMLTDEVVDPLVANYIKSRWGTDVNTLPQDKPVVTFDRFVRVRLLEEDKTEYRFGSVEEIKTAARELEEYRTSHPEQFEDQTFSSLFFGIEELPVIQKKAKALRDFVASAAKGVVDIDIPLDDREALYYIWIDADACARVADMVIGYASESEAKTIKALLPTFARDVHDISFSKQRAISSQCLGMVVTERKVA